MGHVVLLTRYTGVIRNQCVYIILIVYMTIYRPIARISTRRVTWMSKVFACIANSYSYTTALLLYVAHGKTTYKW